MTTTTIEERKQNIDAIKASFPDPAQSGRYRDVSAAEEAARPAFGVFTIKLLIALALFGAFVCCDKTRLNVRGYTTEEVYRQIEEPFPLEKLVEKVKAMM